MNILFCNLITRCYKYLDISPFLGSIVKNSRKSGCGLISTICPSFLTPLSEIVKNPCGSKRAFKRSNTAELHRLTLSISNQEPSCKH